MTEYGIITDDDTVIATGLSLHEAETQLTRAIENDIDAYLWQPAEGETELPLVECTCEVHLTGEGGIILGTMADPVVVAVKNVPDDVVPAIKAQLSKIDFDECGMCIDMKSAVALEEVPTDDDEQDPS